MMSRPSSTRICRSVRGLSNPASRSRVSCLCEQRLAFSCRSGVCATGGDLQLDVRPGVAPAADVELASQERGPLAHPGQAEVSDAPTFGEHLRLDAPAVVPNPQPKLAPFIADLYVDP